MKLCMGCMSEIEEQEKHCPHCGYEEGTAPREAFHMEPGSVLHGKYVVGKVVGYGGFGVTYIGYDAELERVVAIKEYMPSEFSTRIPGQTGITVYEGDKAEQFREGMEKFVDEAKRLAKFQNMDGIVQIYDTFMENETAYLIMEYLEGETLKSKLDREGKLGLDETLQMLMPILSSLKEVHQAGIIHRDIAPDNIMVTKDGRVKLIDFGASRFATTTHSRSLTVLIKQGYAPMEQYNSRGEQGAWTDVYALAATFYKCLTGTTPEDSMERKVEDTLKPPSKAGAKVGKNIDHALMNALNLSIEYRTESVEQFETELLAEKEVKRILEPEKKEDMGKMPLWVKMGIGVVAASVLVFVVLIMTGVIQFGKLSSDKKEIAQGMTYVPNMVNQDVEQAQLLAEKYKVEIQIVDKQYSDLVPIDLVMQQTPDTGKSVSEGSMIELIISAGKEQVYVPSVEGLMQEEAIKLLEEAHLTYLLQERDGNIAQGAVVEQSIEANTSVDIRSCITLSVSNGVMEGIDKSISFEMPEIVNMSFMEAQEFLYDYKLYIVKTGEEYSKSVDTGDIISQSITNGSEVNQGDTVEVVVSLGVHMVRVEDVQYQDVADAIERLENSGLEVIVRYAPSDIVAVGKVISQTLEPGTEVEFGSKIVITISRGNNISEDHIIVPYGDVSSYRKTTNYNADGTVDYVIEYGRSGKVVKITYYNADGTVRSVHEY